MDRALIGLGARLAARRFDRATREPLRSQEALLRRILATNASTSVGRRYGFAAIADADAFRRSVPVRDYEAMRADADATIAEGAGVLCPDEPYFYSLTSGTESEPKRIPVTRAFRRAGREATLTWLHHCLRTHPGFLEGKLLAVTSPAEEGTTERGVPFGSASGRIYREAPFPLRRRYAVPYEVFETVDYARRYALIALFAASARLTGMLTPNPLTLLRVLESVNEHLGAILRSLHDGVIDPSLGGERARTCSPARRDRVRFIEGAVARREGGLASALWPELSVVGCWTSASVGAQLPTLRAQLGAHVPVRDLGLVASEGRISIPTEDESPYGVLAIRNAFFEFVPEEETSDGTSWHTLLCHELEPGRRYRILMTGLNGLYRYDINDIVEVGGYFNQTPRIAFVRKGRDIANLTGEKVHVNQLLAAVKKASEWLSLPIRAFRVFPNADELRYDFCIEPGPCAVTVSMARAFSVATDRELGRSNVEYDAKRRSLRLNAPSVTVMREGWSEAEMQLDLERGKRDVQYKWRHLVEQEEIPDVRFRLFTVVGTASESRSRKSSVSPALLTTGA